jgi:hypothetical protein
VAYTRHDAINKLKADNQELRNRIVNMGDHMLRLEAERDRWRLEADRQHAALIEHLAQLGPAQDALVEAACTVIDLHLHHRDCGLPAGHCPDCERWDTAADHIEQRRHA